MTELNGHLVGAAGANIELQNVGTERLAAEPALAVSWGGRLMFDTGTNTLKYHDGTTWVEVASLSGAQVKALYEAEADTNAFTDAEKAKLGAIEANAKDDQNAAEVPFTPVAGITATDTQGAIAANRSDIAALQGLGGVYIGASATVAGMPTTRESGAALEAGDHGWLTADDGIEAGKIVWNGTAWQTAYATPDAPSAATAAVAGLVELATPAEVVTGTDSTRAATPEGVQAALDGTVFTALIGDATAGPFSAAHGLTGTVFECSVQTAAGDRVLVDAVADGTNYTVTPLAPVATDAYRVVVRKVA